MNSIFRNIIKFILFFFCISCVNAQTLNIPPRDANYPLGSQIIDSISDLLLQDREAFILNEVLKGNIPDFLRTIVPITDSIIIDGKNFHITYYALPDYLAIGGDKDYFLCPMTPILAQTIACSLKCTLPTRKMVNQIWKAAQVKMQPQPIPPGPEMTKIPVFALHDSIVWVQRQSFFPQYPLGSLVSGHKKDVVISNSIHRSTLRKVVIYGWHYPSGEPIQPLYSGHSEIYADYSHGIRMVHEDVLVNGVSMKVTEVLKASTLHNLLSDEGVIIVPNYPYTSLVYPHPAFKTQK